MIIKHNSVIMSDKQKFLNFQHFNSFRHFKQKLCIIIGALTHFSSISSIYHNLLNSVFKLYLKLRTLNYPHKNLYAACERINLKKSNLQLWSIFALWF